jgi:hypothetical protein
MARSVGIRHRVVRASVLGHAKKARRIRQPELRIERMQIAVDCRRIVGIDDRNCLSGTVTLNSAEGDLMVERVRSYREAGKTYPNPEDEPPGFSATGRSAILVDSIASRSTAFRDTVHVTTRSVLRLPRYSAMRLAKPLSPTTSHDDSHVDAAFPNAPGPVQRSVFAVVH